MSSPLLDYLVIGAGPAGLQLGQHLGAAGHEYLIVEAGEGPGSFFTRFPRHRTLISINKPRTGYDAPELRMRMDWNSLLSAGPSDGTAPLFTSYSERYFPPADVYVRYLADYAAEHDLQIRYGTRIVRIAGTGDGFEATDLGGVTRRAKRIVMATGVSLPYVPQLPGVEHIEQYSDVSVDPKDFLDQKVLILGKGNSAFETADNLMETAAVIHVAGPHSVKLAWKTHYVGHLRAVNNNFLDTYQLKSQNAILDGTVRSIEAVDGKLRVVFAFARVDELEKELWYDRVIGCTGFRFDASVFADDCRPRLIHNDRFPVQTPAYESANVPGLYFAGTLNQQRDWKHGTSGFIHGFRYAVKALARILDQRYHETPWPRRELDGTAESCADAVIERVNRSSALWQQFGVLGDVLTFGPGRYFEEVPVEYATSGVFGGDVVVVTLEYGPDHDKIDPFDISVGRIAQDTPGVAHAAAYLHPVLRRYRDGEVVAEHHMAENLENEWNRPAAHREPLLKFFSEHL